jgi:hypothetical protein
MTLSETLKKYWQLIVATIMLLAALLTVIVRTETVWHWMFPSDKFGLKGGILYDHELSSFHFPRSYNDSEQRKDFVTAAQSFIKVNVHNISNIEAADMRLILPGDAVVEVMQNSQLKHSYPASDSFELANLAPGERYTLLIWMKRPFTLDEQIAITNQIGAIIITPNLTISLQEYRFFQRGYYFLLLLSFLLGSAVVILSIVLYKTSPRRLAAVRNSP